MMMKLLLVVTTLLFTTKELVLAVVPVVACVGLITAGLVWPPFVAASGPPLTTVPKSKLMDQRRSTANVVRTVLDFGIWWTYLSGLAYVL